MNALPRHTLTRIINEHGRVICDSPKRVESLLRDLCGAHRREVNILVGAMEERIPYDLMRAGKSAPREVLLAQLTARLQDNLAYTPEAARWAIDSWAAALGVLTEAEVEARAQTERAKDAVNTATHRTLTPPPTSNIQAKPQSPPQNKTSVAPPRNTPSPPPTQSAPARNTPLVVAKIPAPVATAPPQPSRTTVAVPQSSNAPVNRILPAQDPPPRRRRSVLRGCFIFLLLTIVLLVGATFVVPAIITILREEQSQPSINDPPLR